MPRRIDSPGLVTAGLAVVAAVTAFASPARATPRPLPFTYQHETLPAGTIANNDARTAALVANVAIPIGAALAAAGIFVLVTAPAPPRTRAGARIEIAPVVGSGELGMSVRGAW